MSSARGRRDRRSSTLPRRTNPKPQNPPHAPSFPLPSFPHTEVKSLERWTNYSGTIPERPVPIYCTVDTPGRMGETAPRKLKRAGEALRAILDYCFNTPNTTLRTIGSRWSFSNIVQPGKLIVDPANLNSVVRVKESWLTRSYRQRRPGFTPVFVQGGTHIGSLNRRLLDAGLALQTSGAGDGHRIAGCIATGTHGSALGVGAVHDTVLGLHLLTAPDQSIFLQPKRGACGAEVTHWLRRETGLFVEQVNDDELFSAAQVGLGSLGFVHGVVMETEPLYSLCPRTLARPFGDAQVWSTLADLDTRRLHPDLRERPFHFSVVLNPYAISGRPGAFVTLMWKGPGSLAPPESPAPAIPALASDTMGLIAALTDSLDGPLPSIALRLLIANELEKRYKPGDGAARVPGVMFGPTSLPPGHGASTEIVFDHVHTRRALEVLLQVLAELAAQRKHLLGPVAVRFVPKTSALLGPNLHAMNTYVELPSIRNDEVLEIYAACWRALEREGIPFTCHWGQLHGMNPARLRGYFGARVERWKAARDRLLPDEVARRVFSAPLLADVGLA